MNRQLKRMQAKQERSAEANAGSAREQRVAQARQQSRSRVGTRQFLREVIAELRKVAWPTRSEVVNSSIIVLVTVIIVGSLIFGLDYGFHSLVNWIYS